MKEVEPVLAATARAFGLGAVRIYERVGGLGESYRVYTAQGQFHFKRWDAEEELLALNAEVHTHLQSAGLGSAGPLRLPSGAYVADTGFTVQAWLHGTPQHQYNRTALHSFGTYFGAYNQVLASVSTPSWLYKQWTPWQRADSITYMLQECAPRVQDLDLSPEQRIVYNETYVALADRRVELEILPRQLVHGDCGTDNVLFKDAQCVAMIDFTPYLESHAYSFAVMTYWWCIYGLPTLDVTRLRTIYDAYTAVYPWTAAEQAAFPGLMLRASARMLSVGIAFWLAGEQPPEGREAEPEMIAASRVILERRNDLGAVLR